MVGISQRYWAFLLLLTLLLVLPGSHSVHSVEQRDVVINEIAWMGTEASYSDEWMEFYNRSGETVDLKGWSIYGASSGECLNFSAADDASTMKIAPHEYLLYGAHQGDIRSGNGTKLIDIWDASIGLSNSSPGQVILYEEKDCSGNKVDTANGTDGDWFAGNSEENKTMERISPCDSGTDPDNWGTNDPAVASNGVDAGGNKIKGTPKAKNSVFSNTTPVAEIDSPDSTTVGASIELDGSKSTDCDGFIETYSWDLDGDGSYNDGSGKVTSYTPEKSGDKTVNLKVIDNDGGANSASKTISVTGGGTNLPPDAAPGGIYSCSAGEQVTLDASGSSDPDGNIVAYAWDFDGNGNYDDASGVRAEYSCGAPGKESVGLKVTDGEGATDTATTSIDVTGTLEADFSYSPSKPVVGEEIQFNSKAAVSGVTIESREWDFGDGKVSRAKNPVHTFGSAEDYSVRLTVTTETGTSDSRTKQLSLGPGISVNAGEDRSVKLGKRVSLSGKITVKPPLTVAKTSWEVTEKPGSGGTKIKGITKLSPVLIPEVTGRYDLELNGKANNGVRRTDTVRITVEENEAIDTEMFAVEFVSGKDPSYEKRDETGLEVKISGITESASGSVIGYHLEEPPEYDGEERTAISFKDLKVLGLEDGTARVRYYYEEANLPGGVLEQGLKIIYYKSDSNWASFEDISIHPADNFVAGEIPVSDLKGTPLALTGKTGTVEGEKVVVHGPNPVPEAGCIFWFNLPETADGGKLKLYDASGKLRFSWDVEEGQERLPKTGRWTPVDEGGSELKEGLYLYRLKTIGPEGISWSKVKKLVIKN